MFFTQLKAEIVNTDAERTKNFERAVIVLDKYFSDNNLFKISNKEIRLFHWENEYVHLQRGDGLIKMDGGSIFQTEKERAYIQQKINQFWSNESYPTVNYFGAGLYAAHDPFQSESFGNILFELTFHQETKYLDFENHGDLRLDHASREILSSSGCTLQPWAYYEFLMKFDNCRLLVYEVLKKRSVHLVKYDWKEHSRSRLLSLNNMCPISRSAFVIISSDNLKSVQIFPDGLDADQYYAEQTDTPLKKQNWLHSLFHCP